MERFVLDTSVFTNPDVYAQFGESPAAALASFLEVARKSSSEFYMPSSVYDELRLMKLQGLDAVVPEFEATVRIRSPRRFNLQIPANIVYELIDDIRKRIDRGLRIAEEHAKMGREVSADEADRIITRLRERYREALRRGIIDSREDVDVLLLAFELDATLVSADEGLRTWADKVGVKILLPQNLRHVLLHLVDDKPAAE